MAFLEETQRNPLGRRDVPVVGSRIGHRAQSRVAPNAECRTDKARRIEPLEPGVNTSPGVRVADPVRQHQARRCSVSGARQILAADGFRAPCRRSVGHGEHPVVHYRSQRPSHFQLGRPIVERRDEPPIRSNCRRARPDVGYPEIDVPLVRIADAR